LQYPLFDSVPMGWSSIDAPNIGPAGEYCVCPTSLFSGVTADLLIELVRSGRSLEGTGIPKITIPKGGLVEQTIDGGAAQRAIWKTAGWS